MLLPAHKSEDNIIICCKRHDMEKVRAELEGEGKEEEEKTYKQERRMKEMIVEELVKAVEEKDIKVEDNMKKLTTLYRTIKNAQETSEHAFYSKLSRMRYESALATQTQMPETTSSMILDRGEHGRME